MSNTASNKMQIQVQIKCKKYKNQFTNRKIRSNYKTLCNQQGLILNHKQHNVKFKIQVFFFFWPSHVSSKKKVEWQCKFLCTQIEIRKKFANLCSLICNRFVSLALTVNHYIITDRLHIIPNLTAFSEKLRAGSLRLDSPKLLLIQQLTARRHRLLQFRSKKIASCSTWIAHGWLCHGLQLLFSLVHFYHQCRTLYWCFTDWKGHMRRRNTKCSL